MAPKPSAFRAYVEVNGDVRAADAIKAIGHRAAHTLPLMEVVVGQMAQQQKRRVESKPYTPPQANTVARKASENQNPDIFRDEARRIKGQPTRVPDALYRAATSAGAPGQLRHITRASATFGLKSAGNGEFFYARFVQNVKGKKRRIFAISETDALALVKTVASFVYDGWPKK